MNIIFVLLSTLIILSCSQPNGGYRWHGGYQHEGGQWRQWGLLKSVRPLPCKKDKFCRVFVGMFLPKNAPSSNVKFQICNSQNRCVDAAESSIFGTFCRGMRDITNRSPSPSEHIMRSREVTQIFRKEAIFEGEGEGDVTARISSIENPCVMIGLDPVMIWRYDGGNGMGGTAYLPEGSRREDYGTLLDRFDNVV